MKYKTLQYHLAGRMRKESGYARGGGTAGVSKWQRWSSMPAAVGQWECCAGSWMDCDWSLHAHSYKDQASAPIAVSRYALWYRLPWDTESKDITLHCITSHHITLHNITESRNCGKGVLVCALEQWFLASIQLSCIDKCLGPVKLINLQKLIIEKHWRTMEQELFNHEEHPTVLKYPEYSWIINSTPRCSFSYTSAPRTHCHVTWDAPSSNIADCPHLELIFMALHLYFG